MLKWKRLWPSLFLCLLLSACSGVEIPSDKQNYIGQWMASGVVLWINDNGSIEYEKHKGNVNTEINAPIKSFQGNDFEVGIGFFSTTFKVQKPPFQEAGEWKMVVDGVELTRIR